MADDQQLSTIQRKSVTAAMADRFGMDTAAFEQTVRATCSPKNQTLTKEQFAAAMVVAHEYRLNPLTREIFFFPSQNGIVPVVSIDGWARIINENPAMNGMRFEDHREDGKLVSITCHLYRKDREHPISVPEYMEECARPTEPWKKWPNRMLRHKALIQCARVAFGFAGIYDQDEAERIIESEAHEGTVIDTSGAVVVQLNSSQSKRAGLGEWFEQALRDAKTSSEIDALLDDHRYLGMPNKWREAYADHVEVHRERVSKAPHAVTSMDIIDILIRDAESADELLSVRDTDDWDNLSEEQRQDVEAKIAARAMEIAGG